MDNDLIVAGRKRRNNIYLHISGIRDLEKR